MTFECFRKRGRHWQYVGSYDASDSRRAAYAASYINGIKVIGVRPADTPCKLYVYRLKNVANITYA